MNRPQLTADRVRALLAYDPETGVITRMVSLSNSVKIGDVAGYINPINQYRYLYVDGRKYLAHRIAWFMHYGVWPTKNIDHMNGDRIDNRIQNLRDVDGVTNTQNRRRPSKGNTSGLLGVSWMTGAKKWRAQIKTKEKVVYLGIYHSKEDAHVAYLRAKRMFHEGSTV